MAKHNSRREFLKQSGVATSYLCAFPTTLRTHAHQAAGTANISASTKSLVADLQTLIPALMNKHRVPGLSIAFIRDAQIIWRQGFGLRNVMTKEPVTTETIFEAASLSKPIFAYAALKMHDQGMLGLDRPLTDYLPQPFIAREPRLKLITMRMVLSHTSGLPHGRKAGTALSLHSDPGTQFYYSATGFDYLQKVVQQLTKQSLTELMKLNVLEPLGMTHSNFGWLDQYESLAAQGYDEKGEPRPTFNEKYRRANNEWRTAVAQQFPELSYPSAAAGLYATASDFAHYMLEMMAPSRQDAFHLSDSLWKEMLKPQVKVTDAVAWGLGWGLQTTKSGEAFWHWGNWSGAFQHFAAAFRENKSGVVILTNSGNGLKLCPELVLKAINLDIAPLRTFLN